MHLDRDSCTRALEARDARFDGLFYVGIASTGIYCRPICPARATLRKNRRFFTTAAAAERAGFRPCLRCRPELAPGRACVDALPRLAEAAAQRIAAGALNGSGVDALARELGVSGRQLRRAMQQELGVTPIELAQTHRLLLAKQLLTDTPMRVSGVAFASGFQSVRRFNALFRTRYRLNPDGLRRARVAGGAVARRARDAAHVSADAVRLTLAYRAPFAWDALLEFLAARAAPSVERIDGREYARTVCVDGHTGVIRVAPAKPAAAHGPAQVRDTVLVLACSASLMPVLMQVHDRVRRLFDLDAEPRAIERHLRATGLGDFAKLQAGLRVPGAFDTFELAMRAILGQQVSVRGASTLMSRLTHAFGVAMRTDHAQLTHSPVTADRVGAASISAIRAIGLPAARAETIRVLARRVADGELRIEPACDVRKLVRELTDIPGIGPWTAEYIAMRGVHWPDAFPASDLILRRAAGNLTTAKLTKAAERWRPWRAYAAMQLWRSTTIP